MGEETCSQEVDPLIWAPPPQTCSMDNPAPAGYGDETPYVPMGPPAPDEEVEDIQAKYRQQAFEQLGLRDQEHFDSMDMVDRNRLVTQAYAKMYMDDPDTYKWAGMAAYASDKAGEGMMLSGPAGMASSVDGDEMGRALEEGNKAIFQDMYWQHLAYRNGGMKDIEAAYEQGAMTEEQLNSWKLLHEAQEKRNEAMANGDADGAAAADEMIWQANGGLLRHEQEVVLQDDVYAHHREMFKDLSNAWVTDIAGFGSPIPGDDVTFEDQSYTDENGQPTDPDIGNFQHRWQWIENSMLPAYKNLEQNDNESMREDMQNFIDRTQRGAGNQKYEGGGEGAPPYYSPQPPPTLNNEGGANSHYAE